MKFEVQKNEQEKIFDELIAVKLLYKSREKEWKFLPADNPAKLEIKKDLSILKSRINTIEQNISHLSDSFFDVYDSELMNPLSESDILVLRDEIKAVRNSLEQII